jgi:hypothetical protein
MIGSTIGGDPHKRFLLTKTTNKKRPTKRPPRRRRLRLPAAAIIGDPHHD